MKRVILAAATATLTVGLFGAVTPPTAAHAADCIPGAPVTKPGEPRKCLWDGGSVGPGYPHEEDCQAAADRYNDQGPDHDYECEDVFGNSRYWVVRY